MHVALTGVSGFIGSFVARHLLRAGHTVAGLVRSTSRRDHLQPPLSKLVIGDQDDDRVWPDLLDGAECVIHNSLDSQAIRGGDMDRHLQSNLVGSLRLLRASSPRQFVFISSIAVHHDMSPNWHGVIDEEHPLRPSSWYGALKASVEAHLWAEHFELGRHTCALRPCAVYGIDPLLERSHGFEVVQKLKRGERKFTKAGGGKFVHVDDVAAAVVRTVGNPSAAGKPFNMVDCYARWADWAGIAAEILGIETDIDYSSPPQPKNTFAKDAVHSLGVKLDRGHEGIRNHLNELIQLMD